MIEESTVSISKDSPGQDDLITREGLFSVPFLCGGGRDGEEMG